MPTIDELYPTTSLETRSDHRTVHTRVATRSRVAVYAADYGEVIADAVAEVVRLGGGDVILGARTYSIATPLPLEFGVNYIGQGYQTLIVTQSGVSAFTNTTEDRVQRASIRHMRLSSAAETGVAIDFYDCSKCIVEDVFINEFEVGVHIHGSVGGYGAYNRFRDCEFFGCSDKGVFIEGVGHNVNSFIGCHTKSCNIGIQIQNSSNTRIWDATFEACDVGIDLTTSPGRDTQILGCYFEDTTTAMVRIASGVEDTAIYPVSQHVGEVFIDNGTDTKYIA